MAIVTYEHHGAKVFVDEALKGTHREHCLCWKCESFKPGTPKNCPIAERLYKICVDENLVTPVYECPVYIGPRFQEVSKGQAPQGGSLHGHGYFDTE